MTIITFFRRFFTISILLFAPHIYSQETIIPLTEGGWVGGLSGNVSWKNTNSFASNEEYSYYGHSDCNPKEDGFGFSISSRNGRFVINNLSVGFDLQWSENETTTEIGSGMPRVYYEKVRQGFFGLWSRYYLPIIGTGWAIFTEGSVGYGNFKSITDQLYVDMDALHEINAGGFAYNFGLGATMFVSNNVAFEITGRYQGGTLKGDYYKGAFLFKDYEIELANIDILFGIMIYLK